MSRGGSTRRWHAPLAALFALVCALLAPRAALAQQSPAWGSSVGQVAQVAHDGASDVSRHDVLSQLLEISQLSQLTQAELTQLAPLLPSGMVGFCDARGATGVAPLPAVPLQDGVLDADAPRCGDGARVTGASLGEGRDTPLQAPDDPSPLDPALGTFAVPRFAVQGEGDLLDFCLDRVALPRGFPRDVVHPPRV